MTGIGGSRVGARAGDGLRRGPAIWISGPIRLSRAVAAPHPVFWAVTAAIVAIDGIWLSLSGIRLEPEGFLAAAGGVALLLLIERASEIR